MGQKLKASDAISGSGGLSGERIWQPAISGKDLSRIGTSELSRVRGKGPSRSGSRIGSKAGQAIDYKGEGDASLFPPQVIDFAPAPAQPVL